MKMKKGLFILMVMAGSSLSFAQFTSKCKVADVQKLKQSGTVMVAVSDDEEINKIVTGVMTDYWKASKFTVIKQSELDAYLKLNPENYVLIYKENHWWTSGVKSGAGIGINTIADGLVLISNLKKLKRLNPKEAMIYCFMDKDLNEASQQAEFIRQVGQMSGILCFPGLKDNQLGGWKLATLNQKEVLKNELWIAEGDLNKNGKDEAKMKAAYKPYKYKIVTKDEMAKAIIEKKKGVVYAAKATDQVVTSIYGDKSLYFFVVHSTEDGRAIFFMPQNWKIGGFDDDNFDQIKANKVHGN